MARKRVYTRIDNQAFVLVWQTSNTPAEVAQRLNLTYKQVADKAYRLREAGVRLDAKNYFVGRPLKDRNDYEVQVLNRLASASYAL